MFLSSSMDLVGSIAAMVSLAIGIFAVSGFVAIQVFLYLCSANLARAQKWSRALEQQDPVVVSLPMSLGGQENLIHCFYIQSLG